MERKKSKADIYRQVLPFPNIQRAFGKITKKIERDRLVYGFCRLKSNYQKFYTRREIIRMNREEKAMSRQESSRRQDIENSRLDAEKLALVKAIELELQNELEIQDMAKALQQQAILEKQQADLLTQNEVLRNASCVRIQKSLRGWFGSCRVKEIVRGRLVVQLKLWVTQQSTLNYFTQKLSQLNPKMNPMS
jgi:hypothetical protein